MKYILLALALSTPDCLTMHYNAHESYHQAARACDTTDVVAQGYFMMLERATVSRDAVVPKK